MEASDWSKFVCYKYLAATTTLFNSLLPLSRYIDMQFKSLFPLLFCETDFKFVIDTY